VGQLVQVFFYFAGYAATGVGKDLLMYSNDEKPLSFFNLFHAWVASTGAAVVAFLDCCRLKEQPGAQLLVTIPPTTHATNVRFFGFPQSLKYCVAV
jgi:hypothetical protein